MTFRLLLVGAHDHTIERVNDLGLEFVLLQVPGRQTALQRSSAHSLLAVDYEQPENEDQVVELAKQFYQNQPFDCVLTFVEYGQEVAARIADELNLPTNTRFKSMEYTRDKLKMRSLLKDNGIHNVDFTIVQSEEELSAFFNRHKGKVIIKPCRGGGGEGIHVIENEAQIAAAMAYTDSFNRGNILAEQYIEGQEYSVETMSVDGKHEIVAITEKEISPAPYFVEQAHVQPAQVSESIRAKIESQVIRLLALIEHNIGPAHTELKVCDGEVYIIETQLRIGGDQIWEMALGTTGVDLVRETLAAIAGLTPPQRNALHNAMAIRFFNFDNSSVSAIDAPDVVEQDDGLIRLFVRQQNLPWQGPVRKSLDRLGYVLVAGIDSEQARVKAQSLLAQIHFSE